MQEPPAPAIEAGEAEATAMRGPSTPASPRGRPSQEIDYGRRGKGDFFGTFKPAGGEARTAPYASRTTGHDVDVLERVEAGMAPAVKHTYAIMDSLRAQRAIDILLFSLAHPR